MGREVRRVPPNWDHPKTMQMALYPSFHWEDAYQPLHDRDFEDAMQEWLDALAEWMAGGFAAERAKCPDDMPDGESYRCFCEHHSDPPQPDDYRPKWADGEATWYQVYETVSEGTPVTPPFATEEELVDYLATYGDFSDQRGRRQGMMNCGPWNRDAAERFVKSGFAPSMVVENGPTGVRIQMPRDQ